VLAVSRLDVGAYLDRLGLDDPGTPSVAALRRLHRAHVERVPYENLEIQLGRRTTVDPHESADRIVRRRRGGYCFHLNGAFSELLVALGYPVTRHRGGVQRTQADPPRISGAHMPLTVSGLPHDSCPSGVWLVDVGLGPLYEPLPLHDGTFRQGPLEYRLRASDVEPGAWRFEVAPRHWFVGMDFSPRAAAIADFASMHAHLSSAPESPFVRVATVQRRHADGADVLRGLVLTRVREEPAAETTIESLGEWFELLHGLFGLPLDDVGEAERQALWERVVAAHADFEATTAAT
jgi:arylamine N-acetyltransferase